MRRSWRLRSRAQIACLAVIAAADFLLSRWAPPVGVQALFDEPAHAATGLLAIAALGGAVDAPVVLAVLGGSLLIDLDHVPGLLGSYVLENGTPRPAQRAVSAWV